jgi:hypothetical protein
VFRDEAVAAIDAVDRLDEAMTIVSARSAIALSAIGLLVLLALAWAVFGTIPVTVTGRGVFVAGPLRAVVFVPFASDRRLVAGMSARVAPIDLSALSGSAVLASVAEVAPYPATAEQIRSGLQNDALAAQFSPSVLVREVVLTLQTPAPPAAGTPCTGTIIVRDVHPIELLFSAGT